MWTLIWISLEEALGYFYISWLGKMKCSVKYWNQTKVITCPTIILTYQPPKTIGYWPNSHKMWCIYISCIFSDPVIWPSVIRPQIFVSPLHPAVFVSLLHAYIICCVRASRFCRHLSSLIDSIERERLERAAMKAFLWNPAWTECWVTAWVKFQDSPDSGQRPQTHWLVVRGSDPPQEQGTDLIIHPGHAGCYGGHHHHVLCSICQWCEISSHAYQIL